MSKRPLFEVCLQSPRDAINAELGGADRVELCAALVEGGITPDLATIRQCIASVSIPVMVMIRPRGGDFLYDDLEFATMLETVDLCREAGAHGIVFGCLNKQGALALTQERKMVERAGNLQTTFHRAFDVCADPERTLEELIDLGVTRILTSGLEATVPEGKDRIKKLIDQADGRISVMPGCGITPDNARELLQYTGAAEFHATAFTTLTSGMEHRNEKVYMGIPGLPEYERQITSVAVVRQFVDAAGRMD